MSSWQYQAGLIKTGSSVTVTINKAKEQIKISFFIGTLWEVQPLQSFTPPSSHCDVWEITCTSSDNDLNTKKNLSAFASPLHLLTLLLST